jgi:transcriptional regulator with XRE-family HTH domain
MDVVRQKGPQLKGKSEAASTLSRNLERFLEQRGINLPALARAKGGAQRTLYNIVKYRETGKNCPGVDKLDNIAAYFGVPAWYLLLSDDDLDLFGIVVAYQKADAKGKKAIKMSVEAGADEGLAAVVTAYRQATESGKEMLRKFAEVVPQEPGAGEATGDTG